MLRRHRPASRPLKKGEHSPMGLILIILVLLLLVGGLPQWRHSRNWGYGPSGILGLILLILLVMLLLNIIPRGF